MRRDGVVAAVAGKEGDAPAADLADGDAVGRRPVGRVDGDLRGALEEAVETGTSEQAELGAHPSGHRRRQADFSAVFLLSEEPEDDSEDFSDFARSPLFSPLFSPDRSPLFSPGLALVPAEPARRLSVE